VKSVLGTSESGGENQIWTSNRCRESEKTWMRRTRGMCGCMCARLWVNLESLSIASQLLCREYQQTRVVHPSPFRSSLALVPPLARLEYRPTKVCDLVESARCLLDCYYLSDLLSWTRLTRHLLSSDAGQLCSTSSIAVFREIGLGRSCSHIRPTTVSYSADNSLLLSNKRPTTFKQASKQITGTLVEH